jgi:hypothetical protein
MFHNRIRFQRRKKFSIDLIGASRPPWDRDWVKRGED